MDKTAIHLKHLLQAIEVHECCWHLNRSNENTFVLKTIGQTFRQPSIFVCYFGWQCLFRCSSVADSSGSTTHSGMCVNTAQRARATGCDGEIPTTREYN